MKHFNTKVMFAMLAATLCSSGVIAADDPYFKDRIAIQDMLARNIQANDSKKIDALMATYSKKDPEFHTFEQDCIGIEAVTAFNKTMNCRNVPGGSAVPGSAPAAGAPGAGAPGGAPGAVPGGAPGAAPGGAPAGMQGPPAGMPAGMGGMPGMPGGGGAVNPRVSGLQHINCCSVIDFTDKNNATHRGYYYTIANGNIISVGHYEDVLIREDGKWVIKSRRLAH